MTVNLKKGQRISLKKAVSKLKAGFIGLGWNISQSRAGVDFDLDTSAFLLNDRDRLIEEVLRYDLTQDYSVETAMVMAELERQADGLHMNAVGSGIAGGLPALLE